jgi:hypothetical protein
MTGIIQNKIVRVSEKHIVLDTGNSYICSFTEFLPFCLDVYYFSTFKDFNFFPQA